MGACNLGRGRASKQDMKRLISFVAVIVLLSLPAIVNAKRTAPVDVAAVKCGDIQFSAPHSRMGCVEARDLKTGHTWWRQIYVVAMKPDLEEDVQHVFINALEVKEGKLMIRNEAGGAFRLDPQTMAVEVLKGSLIIKTK